MESATRFERDSRCKALGATSANVLKKASHVYIRLEKWIIDSAFRILQNAETINQGFFWGYILILPSQVFPAAMGCSCHLCWGLNSAVNSGILGRHNRATSVSAASSALEFLHLSPFSKGMEALRKLPRVFCGKGGQRE